MRVDAFRASRVPRVRTRPHTVTVSAKWPIVTLVVGNCERPGTYTSVSRLSSDWFSGDLLETLPAAVYVCNAEAVVVAFNRRAAELWGRAPSAGDGARPPSGRAPRCQPAAVRVR